MKKYFYSFLRGSLIPLLLLYTVNVYPCTIIAVGKKASADGSVIISHTDCGADCRIRVVHGQSFKKGEMAPVHWGIQDIHRPLNDFGDVIGHIPQVEKTYTYFHSAYTSPYVPIYAGTQEIASCYKNFDPTTYNNQSACLAIDFVDNLLYLKWQEAVKDVLEVRNPFEERLFSERDRIDSEALALYKNDPAKALEFLTNYTQGNMNEILEIYNNLHDKLIVKYSNSR
jgi:dipeptidase